MREILFRGKQIDNGEWVFGFYFCMYHDADRKHLHHFIIPLNVPIPKDKPIGEIQVEVDYETVGQCVSDLPDKNGKKIFEGDIIFDPEMKDNYIVEFDGGGFCAGDMFLQAYISFDEFSCEVIGNIHDNPELLEDKP